MYAGDNEKYLANTLDRLCSVLNDTEQKVYKNHEEQKTKRRAEAQAQIAKERAETQARIDGEKQQVLDVIQFEPDAITLEQIADLAKLSVDETQQVLYWLENEGRIETKPAKCRRRYEIVKEEQ
jgi:predicted Rossmann fold nucleotide-binding protein DprA/Smf involved in DNA uptake